MKFKPGDVVWTIFADKTRRATVSHANINRDLKMKYWINAHLDSGLSITWRDEDDIFPTEEECEATRVARLINEL